MLTKNALLAVFLIEGGEWHLLADVEVISLNGRPVNMEVLTLCGRLNRPVQLLAVSEVHISCEACLAATNKERYERE